MDTPEFKDMDVELTRSPEEEDLGIEKVITASSEMENDDPGFTGEKRLPDAATSRKNKVKKEKKLKKSERRLNKKYEKLKSKLDKWIGKLNEANELKVKREALVKDLREMINRSVEMKESGKNITLLKKVMQRVKSGKRDKEREKCIKSKIKKLEKKIGRIENKLA